MENKKSFKRSVILLVIAAVLLALVLNIGELKNFFSWIYNAFSALIIGACMAFVLNMLVDFFEEKVFTSRHFYNQKIQITLSLLASIIVILVLMTVLVLIVVPQLIETFRTMAQKLPDILNAIQSFVVSVLSRFPDLTSKLSATKASDTHLSQSIVNFLKNDLPGALDNTFIVASKTVKSVITFFVALLISIYIIISKERLGVQAREFCYGILSKANATRALYVAHLTSKDFKAFILGRVTDAIIMAIAYLIIALIFRLPYTLMIASIIAVFSIIPLFGALISWGVGFILMITVSFWQAVLFSVIILSILFITRNFIYPKLIGDSLGLPDLWVLVAVVIGGKLFGLIGMLTAVPIFSVFYHIIAIIVHTGLDKKKVPEQEIETQPDWQDYNEISNSFSELTVKEDKKPKKKFF